MINKFRNNEISLKKMTGLEFTQLITEWKQELYRLGAKDINNIIVITLEKSLKTTKNDNEITLIKDFLRSVESA